VSGKPTRVLSDAEIAAILKRREQVAAILERRARDERGEVPAPETLTDVDGLLKLGLIDPDLHFLIRRVGGCKDPDKLKDAVRCALVELLREHRRCPDIPLSPQVVNLIADELERPRGPKAGRPALVSPEVLRASVEVFEALNRERVVARPRTTALNDAKEHYGYRSVDAVRKAMQPSRRRRRRPK
jgi:hypothetical protein